MVAMTFSAANALGQSTSEIPKYLKGYEREFQKDPRLAALKWFSEAKYGMFLHYGVYSMTEGPVWIMYYQKIPVAEYKKLREEFDPSGFDADDITDLAIQSGMKYITITTKHHDGFALWDTNESEFKSTNSPSGRDLIKELADACHEKGIALFLYYSYGRDWEHPHGVFQKANGEPFRVARPAYDPPDPNYATGEEYDLSKYVDYVNAQITELLTGYGPIAGIWFDAPPEAEVNYDTFKPHETYEMIHKLQPQCLVSAKWGIKDPNGIHSHSEDFYAPELNQYRTSMQKGKKPIEICHTMNHGWGWREAHQLNKGVEYLKNNIRAVNYLNANLLMNIAPMPDGSIWEEDRKALLEVGQWLKENGWPKDRLHPKDANIGWRPEKTQPPFPNDGPYQPLELPY